MPGLSHFSGVAVEVCVGTFEGVLEGIGEGVKV